MSRAFVSERLAAAAGEINALIERRIATYEERLRRTKEGNCGKRKLVVVLHRLDEQLPVSVRESGDDCANKEKPSLPEQPEHRERDEDISSDAEISLNTERFSDTDNDDDNDDWQRPLSCSPEPMETDRDHNYYRHNRGETLQLYSMREDTGPNI